MVDDVYRATDDLLFLKSAFEILKKEYDFWMICRVSKNRLNRYDSEEDERSCAEFYDGCVVGRIGKNEYRNLKRQDVTTLPKRKAAGILILALTGIARTIIL